MTVSWVTPIASGLSLVAGTGVAPVKIRPRHVAILPLYPKVRTLYSYRPMRSLTNSPDHTGTLMIS